MVSRRDLTSPTSITSTPTFRFCRRSIDLCTDETATQCIRLTVTIHVEYMLRDGYAVLLLSLLFCFQLCFPPKFSLISVLDKISYRRASMSSPATCCYLRSSLCLGTLTSSAPRLPMHNKQHIAPNSLNHPSQRPIKWHPRKLIPHPPLKEIHPQTIRIKRPQNIHERQIRIRQSNTSILTRPSHSDIHNRSILIIPNSSNSIKIVLLRPASHSSIRARDVGSRMREIVGVPGVGVSVFVDALPAEELSMVATEAVCEPCEEGVG